MNLKDQMNGVQHVGVPTNDIETTIKFYEALGFKIAFQTVNEAANEKVAFLKQQKWNPAPLTMLPLM